MLQCWTCSLLYCIIARNYSQMIEVYSAFATSDSPGFLRLTFVFDRVHYFISLKKTPNFNLNALVNCYLGNFMSSLHVYEVIKFQSYTCY